MDKSQGRWPLFFLVTALCIFIYLAFRAWYVPPVHDECATFFIYVQTGNFLPWKAFFDANNHLLNSALSTFFYQLLGDHIFVLRLASLLFFPVYACYVYRICALFFQKSERFLVAVGLLLIHNYTEYFGYCRGYGMGLACCMALLYYLMAYLRDHNKKDLVGFSVFVPLALMSNLNLMLVALVATTYLGIHLFLQKRKTVVLFLFWNMGWLLLFAWYGSLLQKSGALYYGGERGLVADTVNSLSALLSGSKNGLLVYALMLPAAIGLLLLIVFMIRKKITSVFYEPLFAFGVVFWLSVLAIPVMHLVLGTKYPEDRTVIHLALMSLLLFFIVLKETGIALPVRRTVYTLFAGGMLCLFLVQANFLYSAFWKNEAVPHAFFDRVQQNKKGYETYVSGYRLHALVWAYYNYCSGARVNPLQTLDYPDQETDYIIAGDSLYTGEIKKNYTIAARENRSGKLLLERKRKIGLVPIDTIVLPDHHKGNEMYWNLADYRDTSLANDDLCFEISCRINGGSRPDLHFIAKTSERNAAPEDFESVELHVNWLSDQKPAEGYALKQRLYVPNTRKLSRNVIFFIFNPEEIDYSFSEMKVVINRMMR